MYTHSAFFLLGNLVVTIFLCLCHHSAAITTDNYACYKNDVVIDVLPQSDADARFIAGLEDVDIWSSRSAIVPGTVNRIHATQQAYRVILARGNLTPTVVISDLEGYLRDSRHKHAQSNRPSKRKRSLTDDWYTAWHRYDEITAKLAEISAAHPECTTFIPSIGEATIENRNISALRIGRNAHNSTKVALVAGEHAREWVGIGALMWIVGRLVEDLSTSTSVLKTHAVDLYIVPCYNPDGYEYSHEKKRLWRKNRRVNGDGTFGVDLNRNWDSEWCVYGGSTTGSYSTYCGAAPFSEPETRAMSEWMLKTGLDVYVDFHSYAGQILRPYGYKKDASPDEARLYALAKAMVSDIRKASGKRNTAYEAIRGVDLYPASGASDDWAYENAGISTVFTIEVAGSDFDVDEEEIEQRGEELYPAILRVIRENSEEVKCLDDSGSDGGSSSSNSRSDSHRSFAIHLIAFIYFLFL